MIQHLFNFLTVTRNRLTETFFIFEPPVFTQTLHLQSPAFLILYSIPSTVPTRTRKPPPEKYPQQQQKAPTTMSFSYRFSPNSNYHGVNNPFHKTPTPHHAPNDTNFIPNANKESTKTPGIDVSRR